MGHFEAGFRDRVVVITGLWTADRNRPGELAREKPRSTPAITVATLVEMAKAKGHELRVQPLDALAEQVIAGITADTYLITSDLAADAETLRERAGRLAAGTYPTLTSEGGILS